MSRFAIGERDFLMDDEPFRVLSGAIHYFRVHPDHWADRIRKARLMGLNTIETYVPWNLHAPQPDTWVESGSLDLARFLRTIAQEGMRAIVRPGPYICAELDNGGLPAWLFTDPEVGVRRHEPRFLAAVGQYLAQVTRIVAPLQPDAAGPVILIQVENEYGAYGDEAEYLDAITKMIRDGGITVPLTTVDQPQLTMLVNGNRPGLHMTASFGSRSTERMEVLRTHQSTGPLMSSEYWDGWFDSWGTYHHVTSAADSAADLDALLATGASVNLYMFHGGTNFGLTSGANDRGVYLPIVTSYDYDAPLDEAGRPTAKYWAYRNVLGRYTELPAEKPGSPEVAPEAEVHLNVRRPFLDAVSTLPATATAEIPTFAQIGHDSAFLLHTAEVRRATPTVLTVGEVRDRAHVLVDGTCVGILSRDTHHTALTIPAVSRTLTLLVENQGRVNYGPRIGEDKGIIGGVQLDGEPVNGWRTRAVREMDIVPMLDTPDSPAAMAIETRQRPSIFGLTLARGQFDADDRRDRFLDTSTLGKGVAWINGLCLGRYWSRGPQRTLYVPGPILRHGTNELILLELDTAPDATVRFVRDADLGPVES
jgi:beta-galactosidase